MPAFRPGVGISTTRARLVQLYGANHQFEMANLPKGGLCVSILIPAREIPMLQPDEQPLEA
jgi:hypothetical protein